MSLGIDSAVQQVADTLLHRDPLIVLALGVLLSWAAARPMSRALRASFGVTFAALASIPLIAAMTIVPQEGFAALRSAEARAALADLPLFQADAWRAALSGWLRDTDGTLNVLLFLPAGFFWGLALRRPAFTVLALAALSLAIEAYQGLTGTRISNPEDVVANTLGALAGVVLSVAIRQAARVGRQQTRRAIRVLGRF